MPKFVRRVGSADLMTNEYYNSQTYVGKNCGYAQCGTSRQCTHYSFQRSQELAERPCLYWKGLTEASDIDKPMFNRYGFGDAKEWINTTLWKTTEKADEVKLGDVIVYGESYGAGHGHVRVVESIEDDYFICSGGNEDGRGTARFDIKVKKKDADGIILGYIHNPYLNKVEVDYEAKYKELLADMGKIKSIVSKY